MTWQLLVSGLVVVLWIRGLVTNVRGLPLARALYVEHHPDLSRVEAEPRITRCNVRSRKQRAHGWPAYGSELWANAKAGMWLGQGERDGGCPL